MEKKQAEVNIGMIGHVDAGKTSLVEALTGKWVDTHSEELKRGISIRLGYADTFFRHCKKCALYFSTDEACPQCKKKAETTRVVSFVDAPGHENLMTTMLSGAALMHGAVLVVAANETCPQAQTIEHLNAIKLSGIKHIVVAQNKIDLANRDEAMKNYQQIKKFLEDNGYSDSPVIPTAAHFKANISQLIEAIEKTIPTPKFDSKKPLKMYCARSFDVNKPGTSPEKIRGGILGGTIIQGTAKKGMIIEIVPGINDTKLETKIVNIHSSFAELDEALPGGLVAIETQLDPGYCQGDRQKGQLIGENLPKPTNRIRMKINMLERAVGTQKLEVRKNDQVVLSVGTMPVIGTVLSIGKDHAEIATQKSVVFDTDTKIAVSVKDNLKWRLAGYGSPEAKSGN